MRTSLLTILAAGTLMTGCELIAHFDDSLLDGSADGTSHPDVPVDTTVAPDMGVDAGNPVDAGDVVATDAADVAIVDAADVADVATTDATDSGTLPDMGIVVDTGVPDVGVIDTGLPDTGVSVDAGTDVAVDTGSLGLINMNNCVPATATDLTGMAAVSITFVSSSYSPRCIKVTVGTVVTFTPSGTDFTTHPLEGATYTGVGAPVLQVGSPIPTTTSGNTPVPVTFTTQGSWGFLCNVHYPSGMLGAVYVVP